jgi:transitional endoplasmic reticulum ATPase
MAAFAPSAAELGRVYAPEELPSFADVGGMDELKNELRDTLGLVLAHAGEAERYRITWNGILLHGPPGAGKTYVARATAGEFGLSLFQVSTSQILTALVGQSARNVPRLFDVASQHLPCILFFDEFDAVAQRRGELPNPEARQIVNQLLQTLEQYRSVPELIVMAATNDLDTLDEAVIRPGRFDRHIRVDLPDQAAREAIFAAQLRNRPVVKDPDLADLARRTRGLSAAAVTQVVESAAMAALRANAEIDHELLVRALRERGGKDRPTIEDWSWDRVILPSGVKAELQQLQVLVEDPERARALGVEPPSGVLLAGPPGTGKTTIAKVLAAQASCSFYPVSAGDLLSKWVGESEQNVQRLFERARENAPSIVFIDEIDALGADRELGAGVRPINQLLEAMDGIAGHTSVLVLAATNRPDRLDPALVRGGRLSRTIVIPLPDEEARRAILAVHSEAMPLEDVDLAHVAAATDGFAGADLHALCQQAALAALVRQNGSEAPPKVNAADFDSAIASLRASRVTTGSAA